MEPSQSFILGQGASEQLVADFASIAETSCMMGDLKYSPRPTMETLAKFITATASGANKDLALFELAHLYGGLVQLLGTQETLSFLLDPEKPTPNRFRAQLSGKRSGDVYADDQGLYLKIGDRDFAVKYGRMVFLCSLYDFLCSMDGFGFFEDIQNAFAPLVDDSLTEKNLKEATSNLSSIMRKYRIAHLPAQQNDGKFLQLYKFLQGNSEENRIEMDDESVFDFWCLHNTGKDYKGYRTVFDLFCDFQSSFEEARLRDGSRTARSLGVDFEAGELDLSVEDMDQGIRDDWVSPFDVFDQEQAKDVRFFKLKSERKPIEALMNYGPSALNLPHAFLRYESFGQVQSGITTDLQVGRSKDSVIKRANCVDVSSYDDRLQECRTILDHIKKLQAASLHVIDQVKGPDNVVSFEERAKEKMKSAFAKMNRKGFDETAPNHQEVFVEAADALVRLEKHLLEYIEKLEKREVALKFEPDRDKFKDQFHRLYGEYLS